jgi:hypothetical protein
LAYVDVKNQFLGILNRRDITPSLVDTFMKFAVQRIHTEMRVPAMEKVVQVLTDGSSAIPVPGDLLEFISVHTNDQTNHDKLVKTDLQTILKWSQIQSIPKYYHREVATIYLGPYPPANTSIYINYFSDSSTLAADTDTNWLTEVAPMLLIYAALSYASDYFLDDRKNLFEFTYNQTRENIQNMALQDEVTNASVASTWEMS